MSSVPKIRIRSGNSLPCRHDGAFVLYWMIAFRRTTWNFALDRAVEWAEKLRKPLVILEALRCDYPWASDRMHRFMLDGMAENAAWLGKTGVYYYPYVEPKPKAGKGLLAALAAHACVVVTDEFPCFFLPRMVTSAARQVPVLMEVVDSNGLLPLRQAEKAYPTAYAFRRFLQQELPRHLMEFPKVNAISKATFPNARRLPGEITKRWPKASLRVLKSEERVLRGIPLDHDVPPVETRGGSSVAQGLLRNFLRNRLPTYAHRRNEPAHQADERALSAPPLRSYFRASDFHGAHSTRRLVSEPSGLARNGQPFGLVGLQPRCRSFLRPSNYLAGAGVQL